MKNLLIILTIILPNISIGQTLSGYVMDQDNNPIPFANVFFKETNLGTTTDANGYYQYQLRQPGYYDVVYTALGYKMIEVQVTLKQGEEVEKNIYLERDIEQIQEAVINAKRKDPAIGIIKNAIDKKEYWREQVESYSCDVYIKATEVISEREKKRREKQKEQEKKEKENKNEEEESVFEKEKREREEAIREITNGMNMVEIDMRRHFQLPNNIKEIRTGYKKLGDTYGLYYTNTAEAEFNFYDNLMSVPNLNQLPLISPLHITSVLTYKFKLVETVYEGKNKIFKIEVSPRKKGNASWEGFIWIQDELFCITGVDLHLHKGGMYVYDDFNIKQKYEFVNDSIIQLASQEFEYFSKTGSSDFHGKTIVEYSNYELNPIFEKNFFRNEVAVTTQEAYDKDSLYWAQSRPVPLTIEEQRYQFVKDSIEAVESSEWYLDSLDRESNIVTAADIFWFGIDHINRSKKKAWYIWPVATMINPFSIGGIRLGEGTSYFKGWENEQWIAASGYASYGLRNEDIKGNASFTWFHDPMHLGRISVLGANRFNIVAANDAVTNVLQRSNWIEEYTGEIRYQREIRNGLMIYPMFKFVERRSVAGLDFNPNADDWFQNNVPNSFEPYQATIAGLQVSYTPFQKHMTEPYRKVILGSRWPTFSAYYETGMPGVFGSDVQFSYLSGTVEQTFKLGTAGTSSYKLRSGKFLNTNNLRYEDQRIFPRGDKWLFASLMESMQLQDTTLTATDIYLQAHYVHHFNGALMNYIPYIKKLGIHVSAGASALYIKENNYRYGEVFFGIEKGFRIQRYRYRIGAFFVMAESNTGNIVPRVKFAISQYDVRTKSWGY